MQTKVCDGILVLASFDPHEGIAGRRLADSLRKYMKNNCYISDDRMAITEEEYKSIFFDRYLTMNSTLNVVSDMLPARYEFELPGKCSVSGIKYFPDQRSRAHEEDWKNIDIECTEMAGSAGETEKTIRKETVLKTSFAEKNVLLDSPSACDRVGITVKSIYENLQAKEWISRNDGWYQKDRQPRTVLNKVPEIYLIGEMKFDTAMAEEHFDYVLSHYDAQKAIRGESMAANVIVKKYIED